jgi:hypothetical protein
MAVYTKFDGLTFTRLTFPSLSSFETTPTMHCADPNAQIGLENRPRVLTLPRLVSFPLNSLCQPCPPLLPTLPRPSTSPACLLVICIPIYFSLNTAPLIVFYSQTFDFRACVSLEFRPTQKVPANPQREIAFSLVTPILCSCHLRLNPIVIASGPTIANVVGSWLYFSTPVFPLIESFLPMN